MMDAKDLLLSLRKRNDLLAYLKEQQVKARVLPDDYPDHGGGVMFEVGDEHWCADYYTNGNFKLLSWA